MAKRKQIGKRKRFEIFKRDKFTCQYCGRKPPSVLLHVDHIVPVSKGGTNDSLNLTTACEGCNIGKSNVPLGSTLESHNAMVSRTIAIAEQMKAVEKYHRNEIRRINKATAEIIELCVSLTGEELSGTEILSVHGFLRRLSIGEMHEAMEKACLYIYDRDQDIDETFRYFCGICWNKIRQQEDGNEVQL